MKLSSESIQDKQPMDPRLAFGKIDPQHHVALSDNRNPQFSWTDVPEGTQSLVMICTDYDVPSKLDDVNQEDREVPADLPRTAFYHWVMIDIPASRRSIEEGEFSHEVTPRGKSASAIPEPMRHGLNNYTDFMAADQDMRGDYYGYDGPCPPFNDSILHRYEFTLYALDIPKLPLEGTFDGPKVLEAMKGHILDQASMTATYTLNPRLS